MKTIGMIFGVLAGITMCGCSQHGGKTTSREMRMTVLQVADDTIGDTIIVQSPNGQVTVIDTGYPDNVTKRVLPWLKEHRIARIDDLISTHPHDDHFGGFTRLILSDEVSVGRVRWATPLVRTSMLKSNEVDGKISIQMEDEIIAACAKKHVPIVEVRRGEVIDLGGGVKAHVLAAADIATIDASKVDGGYVNNNSLVMRVTYGRTSVMLAADAEVPIEEMIVSRGGELRCDVLKAGHHGGNSSTGERWLDALKPRDVAISTPSWLVNDPRAVPVNERLMRRGIPAFRTSEVGDVTIVSDGVAVRVSGEHEPIVKK